jgi:hypothetical protein
METAQLILNLISGFFKNIFSWPVVTLLMAIIFKGVIGEKIKSLRNFEGYGIKLDFHKETKILDKEIATTEKNIAQITFRDSDLIDVDNNPEIAIPRIYSQIEAAAKNQFGVDCSRDMALSLYDKKIINLDMFIILDSMRALSDNIHITARSQKITKEDIANYENNANRIIEIFNKMNVRKKQLSANGNAPFGQ